jgi:DNA-binding XRE family transcriptional regulator
MTLNGIKVKDLRKARGLSQLDLACEIDCSREIIVKIETNSRKETGLCIAYKIATYFNVTIESLILK